MVFNTNKTISLVVGLLLYSATSTMAIGRTKTEEENINFRRTLKAKNSYKKRSTVLPPLDRNGERIRKSYQFKQGQDSLRIVAKYNSNNEVDIDGKDINFSIMKKNSSNKKQKSGGKALKGSKNNFRRRTHEAESNSGREGAGNSNKVRALPPLDLNGHRIKKAYSFKQDDDGLTIKARYNDESLAAIQEFKSKKGKRYTETMEWTIRSNQEGFNVDTKYKNYNDDTKVETSISTCTMKMVEFVKANPETDDEVFISQPVVIERNFSLWNNAVFEGGCTGGESCKGIFTTQDGCLTVTATANLANMIDANGRFELDPDDVKFDYIFGDHCGVSTNNNGLAIVGKVSSDTKNKIREPKPQLQPLETPPIDSWTGTGLGEQDANNLNIAPQEGQTMSASTTNNNVYNSESLSLGIVNNQQQQQQRQASELEGVESDPNEGVSLFLTWLNEVDCLDISPEYGSINVGDSTAPYGGDISNNNINNNGNSSNNLDASFFEYDKSQYVPNDNDSTLARTVFGEEQIITTNYYDQGIQQQSSGAIFPNAVPRTRSVTIYSYDDPSTLDDSSKDDKIKKAQAQNGKIIHWTINRKITDRSCVWDPVIGTTVYEEETSAAFPRNAILSSSFFVCLVSSTATAIILMASSVLL